MDEEALIELHARVRRHGADAGVAEDKASGTAGPEQTADRT
jgi:hypothetical protein